MPTQADDGLSTISVKIPPNQKKALFLAASHMSMVKGEEIGMSDLVRDAIEDKLRRMDREGGLPRDAREEIEQLLMEDE